MKKISPSDVKYIKLGPGGKWEAECIDTGIIKFGYHETPNQLCIDGKWAEVHEIWKIIRGSKTGTATSDMFDSLIEFIEDSLITRINLILKDEKDTTARLRLIVLLILGFGERNPGLTRILTGHALMFEQDRLQGRINQLFERIEAQLRQVMREKKMREGEGYTLDETLLASQLLAFCEGMLSRFVRSEFKYRPTDDFDARWPLVAAQLQ